MSERRAFFGTLALGVAQVLKLGLQFAVLPVLARILGPSSYGLVALAMPFILFANMLSDAGLGDALVRVPQPSRELQSTVFWLSLGICAVLAAVICLAAWPAGILLHEPGLSPILWALSPILLISGSLSVANATILRERRFAVFALSDTIASGAAAVVAIAAALSGFGAWSLVVQQLVLWGIKGVWVQTAARFLPQLLCRPALAAPYMSFGLHAAASNIADFFSKNAPQVIVGASLGVVAVGHYSMAFQLVRVPDAVISGPIYLAVFTAVARLGEDRAAAKVLAVRGLRAVAIGLAPVFAGLALVADLVVQLMLGPKWIPAIPVLILLAPAGFLLCFYSIISSVLMGLGRSDMQFRLTLVTGAAMSGGAIIGARFNDAAVGAGLSLGALAVGPVYILILAKALGARPMSLMSEFTAPLLATLVMTVAVAALRLQIGHWGPWTQFAAAAGCGVVTYAAVVGLLSGRRMWDDLRMVLPPRAAPQPEAS